MPFLPRDVLGEILDFIESVSLGFPTYSYLEDISLLNKSPLSFLLALYEKFEVLSVWPSHVLISEY